jgi:hypothetical protein
MGDIGDPSTAPWPGDHHDATVAIPGAENLVGCLGPRRKAGDRPEIADRAHESCSGGIPQHLCDIVLVMTVNPGFSGFVVERRMACSTTGPMVMLDTKRPSITST